MIPQYDKDLNVVVTGSGMYPNNADLEEQLLDFMFGTLESREIHLIIPLFSKLSNGMRKFYEWAAPWEFDITFIHVKDGQMTTTMAKEKKNEHFIEVATDREALERALSMLKVSKDAGEDTAFLMMHDPESVYEEGKIPPSDFEIIGDAKSFPWLTTLNLCEGLQDSFEGYESAEEREIREKAEAEFAAQQAQESPAPARKRAAKKTAAKKTTPAPKKAPSSTEGLDNLIKNAVRNDKAHEHFFQWVDNDKDICGSFCIRCGISEDEFHEKERDVKPVVAHVENVTSPELSATIVVPSYAQRDAEETKEIWEDIAKAVPKNNNDLLLRLAQDIHDMGKALTSMTATLMEMINQNA